MVSLSTHSSLSLRHSLTSVDAVSWSHDDRIAVSSQDVIYVFSLVRNSFQTPLEEPAQVPATITLAKIPRPPKHEHTTIVSLKPLLTQYDDVDHSIYLDPCIGILGESSKDGFTQANWSPSGCGPNGRCLLTCLTKHGTLVIYSPPSSLETSWNIICSVSSDYRLLLETVDYDIATITNKEFPLTSEPLYTSVPSTSVPSTSVPSTSAPSTSALSTSAPSTSVPSTSVPSTSVPSTSVPSTSVPSTSIPSTSVPSTSVPSTSAPSTSVPSTSVPSTSVPSTSVPSTSVPSTSVPSTSESPSKSKGRPSFKATLDRSVHQRLLEFVTAFACLPFTLKGGGDQHHPSMLLAVTVRAGYLVLFSFSCDCYGDGYSLYPIATYKLLEGRVEGAKISCWPCTLTFMSLSKDYVILVIGFTDGSLKYLCWNDCPHSHVTPEYFTKPCSLNTLWPFADEIPVHLLTCINHNEDGKSVWCVFAKSSHLMIVPISLNESAIMNSYGFVSGYHGNLITGLTALTSNAIVSTSRDGVVQVTHIPRETDLSGDGHMTTEQYCVTDLSSHAMEVPLGAFKHSHSSCGIGTSSNKLFIGIAVNFSHLNKLETPSELRLISINDGAFPFKFTAWDVYEYCRLQHKTLPPHSDLRVQLYLQQHQMTAEDDNDMEMEESTPSNGSIEDKIIINYVKETFSKFIGNSEFQLSDQCKLSLYNQYVLLQRLINYSGDILDFVKDCQLEGISEHCAICNEVIPFTCCHGESCSQGHYWKRCVLTQRLITSPRMSKSCSLCGRHAYSINSDIDKGTWLSWLLNNTFHCPFCGGFFNSFVCN